MSTEDGVAGRWDGVDVHFGEEGGRLTYGSYLRLGELLDQQRLESDPPAHDELLFITIHQVYELWFKQVLHELSASRDAMLSGELWLAQHLLRRAHTIERTLIQQVDILETMTPQDFGEFRHRLSPASGFQSVQFREIEFLSGLREPGLIRRLAAEEGASERLERRLEQPTLWDAFLSLMEERGLPMPPDDETARRGSLLRMMREERFADVVRAAEALLTHDELFILWRHHHVLMVERQIGGKTGTGGSTGAPYLRGTLDKRFYPELWDVRSYL
jgi:tryptophan 2,3-dioxygenase